MLLWQLENQVFPWHHEYTDLQPQGYSYYGDRQGQMSILFHLLPWQQDTLENLNMSPMALLNILKLLLLACNKRKGESEQIYHIFSNTCLRVLQFTINPLYTGGHFQCYLLDICHLRGVRSISHFYSIFDGNSC